MLIFFPLFPLMSASSHAVIMLTACSWHCPRNKILLSYYCTARVGMQRRLTTAIYSACSFLILIHIGPAVAAPAFVLARFPQNIAHFRFSLVINHQPRICFFILISIFRICMDGRFTQTCRTAFAANPALQVCVLGIPLSKYPYTKAVVSYFITGILFGW